MRHAERWGGTRAARWSGRLGAVLGGLLAAAPVLAQPAVLASVLAETAPGGGRIDLRTATPLVPPKIAYDRADRRLVLTFLPAPEGGPGATLDARTALAGAWPSWTSAPAVERAGDTLRLVFAFSRPLVPGTAWRRGAGGRLSLVLFGVAPDTAGTARTARPVPVRFYAPAPLPERAAERPPPPPEPSPDTLAVPTETPLPSAPPASSSPAPLLPASSSSVPSLPASSSSAPSRPDSSSSDPPARLLPPRDSVRSPEQPSTTFYTLDRADDAEVIVLDAGHGGHDTGATDNGIREKDVTLGIVRRLGALLEAAGRRVVYTRVDDVFVPLQERGRRANAARGTLFVSVHVNATATGRPARGTETYLLGLHKSAAAEAVMERENSVIRYEADPSVYADLTAADHAIRTLAGSAYQRTAERLASHVEAQFRAQGRLSRGVRQAGFYVLWSASMPSILVETGFVNDPGEARYLASAAGQDEVARAIFRAIDAVAPR